MRAMLLHELGGSLTLAEVEEPRVGACDAKIKIRAAGVGLTIVIMMGTPGLVTSFPRILGHEIVGDVVELGSEVRNLTVGDRVVCHFYLTCGACKFCRSGRETLCENWGGYVGMARDGGYAEYMSIPARNLCKLPEGIPYPEASIISDAIATPLRACRAEANVGPGDDVLIIGAGGGVGIHAVQIAKLCGARVIAADVAAEKLELARTLGADQTIDSSQRDLRHEVMRLTDGHGVNAVLDFVASSQTLEASVESLATAGKLVILGYRPPSVFNVSPTFRVDPLAVLGKGLTLRGSRYVSMGDLMDAVKIVKEGKVKPVVTRTFPLEQAETAHRLIKENKVTGRAALII